MTITVLLKSENGLGSAPKRGTNGALAYDIASNEDCVIEPGQIHGVKTGLRIAMPEGWSFIIAGRSGLAIKKGIFVQPTIAIIDSDYRGEIHVGLYNSTKEPFIVKKGDRIAQGYPKQHVDIRWEHVGGLPPSERGDGGLGSTGV